MKPSLERTRDWVLSVSFFLMASLSLVAMASPAHAAHWFVDQLNGSDDNSGSRNAPLRFIETAIFEAQPGDTINVADGDYSSDEYGYGDGVVALVGLGGNKPIRLRAAPGACPIVRRFFVENSQNIRIEGFACTGTPFTEIVETWQDMPAIVRACNGVEVDYMGEWESRRETIEAEFADYFTLVTAFESVYESAFDVKESHNIQIQNNHIRGYWAGIQSRGSSQLRILNNDIRHCVNGIYAWEPAPGMTDSLIRGNVISQCLDNGVDLRQQSANVKIVGNHVSFSGRNHISLFAGVSNCLVANNNVEHGGHYSETMSFPGSSAISLHSSLGGNRVVRNQIRYQIDLTGIDGNGIILDFMEGGSSVRISNNVCYRNMGSGVNTTISPNAVIANNLFVENGWRSTERRNGAGIKLSRDDDIGETIVGNLFVFNRVAGIMTNFNLEQQRRIDRNTYVSIFAPLIWDGFDNGQLEYRSLWQIQCETGWERRGFAIGPFLRR